MAVTKAIAGKTAHVGYPKNRSFSESYITPSLFLSRVVMQQQRLCSNVGSLSRLLTKSYHDDPVVKFIHRLKQKLNLFLRVVTHKYPPQLSILFSALSVLKSQR